MPICAMRCAAEIRGMRSRTLSPIGSSALQNGALFRDGSWHVSTAGGVGSAWHVRTVRSSSRENMVHSLGQRDLYEINFVKAGCGDLTQAGGVQIDPLIPLYCHIIEITRRASSMSASRTFPTSISIMRMFGYYY